MLRMRLARAGTAVSPGVVDVDSEEGEGQPQTRQSELRALGRSRLRKAPRRAS